MAASYALFLVTAAMGLTPWHRWGTERSPWRPNVAWKRHERVSGKLPALGRTLATDELPAEEWSKLAQIADGRDVDENLENIIWTAVKLGKDAIAYQGESESELH